MKNKLLIFICTLVLLVLISSCTKTIDVHVSGDLMGLEEGEEKPVDNVKPIEPIDVTLDEKTLDVTKEEVTKDALNKADKIILEDKTEINKEISKLVFDKVTIETSNKAIFQTPTKWSSEFAGKDILHFNNGYYRCDEYEQQCICDNEISGIENNKEKHKQFCYPNSYIQIDNTCYEDCIGCKDGATPYKCKSKVNVVNITNINFTSVQVKYPNEKLINSKLEYAYDPSYSYVFKSTACSYPNKCYNVTTYHGNLTLNATTDAETPPIYYFPFDIGDGGFQTQNNNCSEELITKLCVRSKTGDALTANYTTDTPNGYGRAIIVVGNTATDRFYYPYAPINFMENDFTIEYWFKMGSYVADNTRVIQVYYNATNYIQVYLKGGSPYHVGHAIKLGSTSEIGYQANADTFNQGTWTHLVLLRNSTGVLQFTNTVPDTLSSFGGFGVGTEQGIFFGERNSDVQTLGARGIDEVKIYNYALSQAQITKHYQQGIRATRGEYQFNVSSTEYNMWNISTTFTENNSVTNSVRAWNSTILFNPYVQTTSDNNAIASTTNGTFNYLFSSTNASRYFLMNDFTIKTWLESETPPVTSALEFGESIVPIYKELIRRRG